MVHKYHASVSERWVPIMLKRLCWSVCSLSRNVSAILTLDCMKKQKESGHWQTYDTTRTPNIPRINMNSNSRRNKSKNYHVQRVLSAADAITWVMFLLYSSFHRLYRSLTDMLTFIWLYLFYCKVTTVLKDTCGVCGDVVIKALRCESIGRGFDSRCCHWNFSVK